MRANSTGIKHYKHEHSHSFNRSSLTQPQDQLMAMFNAQNEETAAPLQLEAATIEQQEELASIAAAGASALPAQVLMFIV